MKETLEDNILVACRAGIVDATQSIRPTGSRCGVGCDVARVVLDRIGEKLVVFPLAA